jgi:hypothetical protein
MSWEDIIKQTPEEAKADEARQYVLNQNLRPKLDSIGERLREFARRFPAHTPPTLEDDIKRLENIAALGEKINAQRKEMEESKNRKNPFSKE